LNRTYTFVSIVLLLAGAALGQGASTATHHKSASSPASKTQSTAATSAAQKQPSTQDLNEFLRHMFGYDPNLKWAISDVKPSEVPGVTEVTVSFGDPPQQKTPFYVTADMQHAFIGQIIPFGADPFAPVRTRLAAEAKGPVQGNANAPVEIVEFSDLQCPHCKHAMPIVEKLMNESPNARLVFEQFPLPMHPWAERAADYADCIGRKDADQFWKFTKEVFDQQEQITAENVQQKLGIIATDAGADALATASCADTSETKARVNQQYQLGAEVGVTGTPTLFINGRRIDNVNGTPYEVLKQMVDFEAKEGGTAK
jgi:protein-disulfide isomerase